MQEVQSAQVPRAARQQRTNHTASHRLDDPTSKEKVASLSERKGSAALPYSPNLTRSSAFGNRWKTSGTRREARLSKQMKLLPFGSDSLAAEYPPAPPGSPHAESPAQRQQRRLAMSSSS